MESKNNKQKTVFKDPMDDFNENNIQECLDGVYPSTWESACKKFEEYIQKYNSLNTTDTKTEIGKYIFLTQAHYRSILELFNGFRKIIPNYSSQKINEKCTITPEAILSCEEKFKKHKADIITQSEKIKNFLKNNKHYLENKDLNSLYENLHNLFYGNINMINLSLDKMQERFDSIYLSKKKALDLFTTKSASERQKIFSQWNNEMTQFQLNTSIMLMFSPMSEDIDKKNPPLYNALLEMKNLGYTIFFYEEKEKELKSDSIKQAINIQKK